MSDQREEQRSQEEVGGAEVVPGRLSRRKMLAGGGLGALGLLAAACGGDSEGTAATGDATAAGPGTTAAGSDPDAAVAGEVEGDAAVAMVAAGLEVLAVNTYDAALEAAGSGGLGEVPAAVGEFITTARAHHQGALDAWNTVLFEADEELVTTAPTDLEATVNDQLGQVTDVAGVVQVALMLERIAAATYLAVIPTLEELTAIDLAASIQPIDMQHIAVLLFVSGEYPVPDTFASTGEAYSP